MPIAKRKPPIPFKELGIILPEKNLADLGKDAFNKYLGALFLARETLKLYWEEGSRDLEFFDVVMSAAIMIAVERRGLLTLMGEAQLLGWVNNGSDILPLIESRLRVYFESMKVGNKEKLESIPIISVVGKIASGKGTVAEILNQTYDVASFPFSERLRALALTMGYRPPYTRAQLRAINDIYKPNFGNQIFVEWTMIQAARMSKLLHIPQFIVVDGFRSVEEAEFFLDQPNTYLVAIVADHDEDEDRLIRFNRQKKRQRGEEDSLTMSAFMKDDVIEGAWINPVIDLAKERGKIILNVGSLDDLSNEVMRSLNHLLPT